MSKNGPGGSEAPVIRSALLLRSHVTAGKSLSLAKPQGLHFYVANNLSTYLTELL